MMLRHNRSVGISFVASAALAVISASLFAEESAPQTVSPLEKQLEFNRDIRPILSDKCYHCHGPDGSHRKADLRLDTSAGAREIHDGRRAVAPGKVSDSELIQRIISDDDTEQMPPPESGKKLTADEIETLRKWIEQGADYQPHWSYLAVRRPAVPAVVQKTWPLNPIDRFLLARLEAEELSPASEADPAVLIRRVTLDLTGLLPTTTEVEAYLQDAGLDRFERLVDRLLDSPHFGERMAMYWLDLVRYANTVGYHGDQEHPITPYRDYVIQAFNENLPFDEFTREQLAGDLLPNAGLKQKIASGYNRLLQTSHEGGVQVKEYLHKYDADRVRNLSGVWMGATLGCAECHNHKYDPYTQRAFYQMAAFFADIDELRTFKGGDSNPTKREPEMVIYEPADQKLAQELEQDVERLQAAVKADKPKTVSTPGDANAKNKTPDPDAARLKAVRQHLEVVRRRARRTMVTESVAPKIVRVLGRGDWMDESGEIVEPAVPDFLPGISAASQGRLSRLDLANWLTSAENPLTSRVFANRLWYLFFGVGLANSLDDLGAQGEWPRHPELLDWLAAEFIESHWDVKHLTRLIVTSQAYRQSSALTPLLRQRDPENHLFARQSQFRLPAEMIRDNALCISGLLIHRQGGTSHPYQPVGYYQYLNFPKREYLSDKDENQYRRGVYLHWQRQYLHPMLKAFDASTREECAVRRPISNTPLAALTLLNDPTFLEAAKMFAVRILRDGGTSTDERIKWAWQASLQRAPSDTELAALRSLYESSLKSYSTAPEASKASLSAGLAKTPGDITESELAAWNQVSRALLNLHETITRN
jgi:hypothetical protein